MREIIIDDFITAYIPNSFTPNDDGINDQFGVTGFSNGGFSMQIFNRWGQTVFTSENSFQSWNGKTLSGKSAPQGIYTYLITITKDKFTNHFTELFHLSVKIYWFFSDIYPK
ncbi:MAG: gliding motility-associated C-terminal domain-containing protein [Bacteroidetes bacterium]|nr:gliding motility-associated C-terminal domain-containing protein [Bacteroidota bacterium]